MILAKALANVRYVTDADGQKTDAILPIQVWSELLVQLKEIAQQTEEQEEIQLIQAGLQPSAKPQEAADEIGFGEALQRFRQVENIAAAGINPDEIFGNIRDASPGREVVL